MSVESSVEHLRNAVDAENEGEGESPKPRPESTAALRKLLVEESGGRNSSLPLGWMPEEHRLLDESELSVERIFSTFRNHGAETNEDLVRRAFDFAARVHQGQKRLSGNPYLLHPLVVATILADLELDSVTLVAGLLHDTVEDTPVTIEDVAREFGDEVAGLVDGVTKLGRLDLQTHEEHQNENLRRLLVATARDVRVIVIKLADRLHNMRTLRFLPLEKQIEISQSTLNIYAPLAHRMGIGRIKWELEDLSLAYLNPDVYRMLRQKVDLKLHERHSYVDKVREVIGKELRARGVDHEIFGRVKHFYSVWRKMQKRQMEFDRVLDLMAIRVITDTMESCYMTLGVIHSLFTQVPNTFKDYISNPKENGYQSLHTTVFGPENRMLEVQIRTWEMHRIAQQGVAAHWRYKENRRGRRRLGDDAKWLTQLSAWLEDTSDTGNVVETLRAEVFADEIFCYTPRNEIVRLPAGSTPIDFAYKIHSELGDRVSGAKVGGKIVPIDHTLRTGDRVEILTSRNAHPRPDWLNMARTSRAKSKVRRYLIDSRRDELLALGRTLLTRELTRERYVPDTVFESETFRALMDAHDYASLDDLFVDVGFGRLQTGQVLSAITTRERQRKRPAPRPKRRETIRSDQLDGLVYRRALCCNPVPGEPTIGIVTKTRGISIHRADCRNVQAFKGETERMIEIFWETEEDQHVRADIDVEATDRKRLLSDISNVIASTDTNIVASTMKTFPQGKAKLHFVVDISDMDQLEGIMKRIERLPGIVRVSRRRTPLSSRTPARR